MKNQNNLLALPLQLKLKLKLTLLHLRGYHPDKMPILQFYTSPAQLSAEEKAELVKTITERYTQRLPAFFVNVMFNEVSHHPPLLSPLFPHSPSQYSFPSYPLLAYSYAQLITNN